MLSCRSGIVLFPVFVAYEIYVAPKPFAPVRFFKNRTIAAACAIGFLDFFSFYLQVSCSSSELALTCTVLSARRGRSPMHCDVLTRDLPP